MTELILVFILIALSVWQRMQLKARAYSDFNDILTGSKPSLFSEAITSLVATSGGIYLSLVLMATFLDLELPSTVQLFGLKFEPVAGTAVILALIQPFIRRILNLLLK